MKRLDQGGKDIIGFIISIILLAAFLVALGTGIQFFSAKNRAAPEAYFRTDQPYYFQIL